jgi:hypothetical protein
MHVPLDDFWSADTAPFDDSSKIFKCLTTNGTSCVKNVTNGTHHAAPAVAYRCAEGLD